MPFMRPLTSPDAGEAPYTLDSFSSLWIPVLLSIPQCPQLLLVSPAWPRALQ